MCAVKVVVKIAFTVVVTVVLTVAVTPEANAQVGVGLGVGSGIGQIGTGAWLRESRLAPSVRVDAPAGFVRLDASALERSGSLSLERAALDGAASTPAFGPMRFTFTGQFRDARFDTAQVTSVGSALSLKHRGSGVWVGTVHDRAAATQFQLGAWQVLRSAILSISTHSRASTMTERNRILRIDSIHTDTSGWQKFGIWEDRVNMTRSRRWSDVQARIDWSGGRLALTAVVTRSNLAASDSMSQSRGLMWGSVNAAFLLNHRVSLVSTLGTLPTGVRSDAAESRYATLGLRFAPAALVRDATPAVVRPSPSAFRVQPIDSGLYRIVLRSPGARTVELSGDFNQWKAVALTQTSPDVWEISLPLAAGTHRVNVRVNGDRWSAPPGLPSVNDEFNGRVGLLVVK